MHILLLCAIFSACFAAVKITEVVPHSDVEDGYYDYVELWNNDDKPADISGHYLSDKGSELLRCQIKPGTVLAPGEHRSFAFQPGLYCPFRLSKLNDHVYYGRVVAGKYESIDDVNIGATINRVSNQRWKTSDDKTEYLMAFPTENFDERYPIVGPFVIDEIVWNPPAGKQSYVKITCIFGKFALGGPSQLTTRGGYIYQLRFEQHKDLYTGADQLTPAAFNFPSSVSLTPGQSYYVVSANPAAFAAERGIPAGLVGGPFSGSIINRTSGNIWVGMFGQEHGGMWLAELVRWKDKEKDGWRPMANGGIRRLSKHSVSTEPDNWIGIGNTLPCNMSAAFPASDCPHLDMCTGNLCVAGQCVYDALVCNHPNWDRCYPDYICRLPAPPRYNAGCKLTSSVFGHTTGDTQTWGFYGTVGAETKWYDAACTNRALDCDVGGWEKWSKCKDCHDNQTRTREVQQAPSKNPDGRACPNLNEKRHCNYDGKCKPCDYLTCTLPKVCWPNMTDFTAACYVPVPCVMTDLLSTNCSAKCGGGNFTWYKNVTKPAMYGGKCDLPKPIVERCNEFPCPIHCEFSTWSAWSPCTRTCGGGMQNQTRTIKVPAAHGGKECEGATFNEKLCNADPCPIDCVGGWEGWSECNCMTATQERLFKISTASAFGGKNCDARDGDKQTQVCQVESCVPVDCKGAWGPWSNCSCETSSQSQDFIVSVPAKNGGAACPEDRTNSQLCEPVDCPAQSLQGWAIALIVVGAVVGALVVGAIVIGAYTSMASSGAEYTAY